MGRSTVLYSPLAVAVVFFSMCFIMYISNASPFLVLKWSILGLASIGAVLYLLNAIKTAWRKRRDRDTRVVVNVAANEVNRYMLAEEKQAGLTVKSAAYEKRVVEPMEEARVKRAEEEAMKFSRWKGGHQLGSLEGDAPGGIEEGQDQTEPLEGDVPEEVGQDQGEAGALSNRDQEIRLRSAVLRSPSMEAAEKRRLDVSKDLLHRSSPQCSPTVQQDDREPSQVERSVTDDCVTIAMKLPNGKLLQHVFNVTEPVEVLYKWIADNGCSRKHCDIVSTYPRQILSNLRQTLMEAGLGSSRRLTLAVEYK